MKAIPVDMVMRVGWAPASVSRYGKGLWISQPRGGRPRAKTPPGAPSLGLLPSMCVPTEALEATEIGGELVREYSPDRATKYVYSFTRAVADGGDEVLGQVAVSRRDSLGGLFYPRDEWTFRLKKGSRTGWSQ